MVLFRGRERSRISLSGNTLSNESGLFMSNQVPSQRLRRGRVVMARVGIITVVASVSLTLVASAVAVSGWRVVAHASASGQFAATATTATVQHPKALAVKLIGPVSSGDVAVSCTKGFSISSNSRTYSHSGLFRLPMTHGADSCDIVASVGGSGHITVQVLARR